MVTPLTKSNVDTSRMMSVLNPAQTMSLAPSGSNFGAPSSTAATGLTTPVGGTDTLLSSVMQLVMMFMTMMFQMMSLGMQGGQQSQSAPSSSSEASSATEATSAEPVADTQSVKQTKKTKKAKKSKKTAGTMSLEGGGDAVMGDGSVADKAVKWATSLEGQSESSGWAVNKDLASGVTGWGSSLDSSKIPWCAAFVSAAYFKATGKKPAWGSAAVASIRAWGQKNSGRWIGPEGLKSGKVQKGDIVIFENNRSHMGIVTKVNSDGSFETIEGNSSNAVKARKYSASESSLTGFVRP